jgi:Spy/CpxP family protein refolding chaperone
MIKKIQSLLVLSLLLTLGLKSFSQNADQKISSAASGWTTKMNEWLKLSPEKSTQLTNLNEQMLTSIRDAYKPVKSNPSATDEEKKAAMRTSMDALKKREKDINQLLSKDELAIYKAHQKESRAMAQTKIMSNQLDLTPDQESKIEAINLEASKKVPENADRKNRSEMSKSEKRELGQAMRKVQQDKEKAYAEVLTAEQMKKYTVTRENARNQMRNRRKAGNS